MNKIVVNGSRDVFPSFELTHTVNGITRVIYNSRESSIGGLCLTDNLCGRDDFGIEIRLR
jgi:hypothetical protein